MLYKVESEFKVLLTIADIDTLIVGMHFAIGDYRQRLKKGIKKNDYLNPLDKEALVKETKESIAKLEKLIVKLKKHKETISN